MAQDMKSWNHSISQNLNFCLFPQGFLAAQHGFSPAHVAWMPQTHGLKSGHSKVAKGESWSLTVIVSICQNNCPLWWNLSIFEEIYLSAVRKIKSLIQAALVFFDVFWAFLVTFQWTPPSTKKKRQFFFRCSARGEVPHVQVPHEIDIYTKALKVIRRGIVMNNIAPAFFIKRGDCFTSANPS